MAEEKDNTELIQVLGYFRDALNACWDRLEQMDKMYEEGRAQTDERLHDLENTVYEDIIGSTQEYIDEQDKNARFDEFSSKYGEKLGAFNGALKPLEGEDFDLTKSTFDAYDEMDEKPDEGAFVDSVIEEVSNQIAAIKKGLGIPDDAEVTVTQDGEGNTQVEADGEVVAESSESTEENAEAEEPKEDGEVAEEKEVEEEEDDPDEIAAFEEELKKIK